MLELHNVRMEPSTVRKKSKGITKCEKRTVTCNKNRTCVMLVLLNIAMEPANLRKKIKELLYVTKELSNVIFKLYNEDVTVKCEKKVREPPNVIKELSHVMLELHNVRMEPSNVRKK